MFFPVRCCGTVQFLVLDYSGIYTLCMTAKSGFFLFFFYAILTRTALKHGIHTLKFSLEIAGIACFLGGVLWIDWTPLTKTFNCSADHGTQFTLAQLTWENLKQNWQSSGWCSAIGTGFPLNEQVPPGGSLWYCAIRFITLGFFQPEKTYSLAVLFSYLVYVSVLYAIVRTIFSRTAAILLLVFLCIQTGTGCFEAGYFFDKGLWNSGLGLAFSMAAFVLCSDLHFNCCRWKAAAIVIFFAASILMHPVFLIINAVWIFVLCLARAAAWLNFFCGRDTTDRRQIHGLFWFATAVLTGLGIAAFYWMPLLYNRVWSEPNGYWGHSLVDLGKGIVDGGLFPSLYPFYLLYGIAGTAWGLIARRPFALYLSFFSLLNLFLGSATGQVIWWNESIKYQQFWGAAKISWVMLASGMLSDIAALVISRCDVEERFWHYAQAIWCWQPVSLREFYHAGISLLSKSVVFLFLSIPATVICLDIVHGLWRWDFQPARTVVMDAHNQPVFWHAFLSMNNFLQIENPQKKLSDFLSDPLPSNRVASKEPSISVSTPYYGATGVLLLGSAPSMVLQTNLTEWNEWIMELTNCNYVYDWKKTPQFTPQQLAQFIPCYQNDEMILYRHKTRFPQGFILSGPGKVERMPSSGRTIRFQVSGTDSSTSLRVGISRCRKWKAYLNNSPVSTYLAQQPVEPSPEADQFIGLRLQDGILEFRYEREMIDLLARNSSLCSLILLLLIPFIKKSWFQNLHTGKLNTLCHWSNLMVYVALASFILLHLTIMPIYENRKESVPTCLTYKGLIGDFTGEMERQDDGKMDWCYELTFVNRNLSRKISLIDLYLVDDNGFRIENAHWTTRDVWLWKIAAVDMFGSRCDLYNGKLAIPPMRNQHLWLFISPPPEWARANPSRVKILIQYNNGEKEEINSY